MARPAKPIKLTTRQGSGDDNASIGHDGATRSCHSSLKSFGASPNFFNTTASDWPQRRPNVRHHRSSIAFELSEKRKAIVADALAGASAVVYLTELEEPARAEALRNTGALLTFNTSKELRSGEAELLNGARLIQFIIAGVDFIPLGELPEGVPVATNGGRLCRVDG